MRRETVVCDDGYPDGACDGACRQSDVCGGIYRAACHYDRFAGTRIYGILPECYDI